MEEYDDDKLEFNCAAIYDESDRRFLDFNLKLTAPIMRLLDSISALKLKSAVIAGASDFF